MKRITILVIAVASAMAHGQISLSSLDDFQDGTLMDWAGGAHPTNIDTGGPGGVGDKFLQLTSTGGILAGSKMAATNDAARWTGDYKAAGVSALQVWMKNFGDTDLHMRAVLFQGDGNRFTSVNDQFLKAHQDWTLCTFSLGENDLVKVLGNLTYDQMITNVGEIMFRHSVNPSAGGDSVVAEMGWDDIKAVPEPCTLTLMGVAGMASIASSRRRKRS